MSVIQAPCPANSVLYNKTLCACAPGYMFNATSKSCNLFSIFPSEWVSNTGVDYTISFPETIFSFDQIKRFTQSQAVFLEATAIMLASWLLFCAFVRFGKLGDGKTIWFQIRWWISRLDICFATRHWLVICVFFLLLYIVFFWLNIYKLKGKEGFLQSICELIVCLMSWSWFSGSRRWHRYCYFLMDYVK